MKTSYRSRLCAFHPTARFDTLLLLLLLSALLIYSLFCLTTYNVNNDHIAQAIPNNRPPLAKVGPDQTVNENATVMLLGVAIDPDPNDKLSYSWTQTSGPAVILNGANTSSPIFTVPSNMPSDHTQLKFSLTAKDNKGAASDNPAIVTITVKHINRPPVVNAGTEQTVNAGYIVTLDGTKSKDPDSSDQLTYSWVQTAGPTVMLNNVDSPIATFTAPNNISTDTTLVFKLTVRDSKNGNGTANVKVVDKYIPPPNQPPLANAGSDQTVNAAASVHLDGSGSRDPDGNVASYSWKQLGGLAVKVNNANTASPTFTAPSNISTSTLLVFGLTVKDSKNATGISTVKITVNPVNHLPLANTGTDQTVSPGYIVTLDGSKSYDPDNDRLAYSWTQTSGPKVTLNNANSPITTFAAPTNISSDTDMGFKLTVTDDENAASNATVQVTDKYVPPPNQPPTADAGIDQTVNAGDRVHLDGAKSKDPNGTIKSYSWKQIGGPAVKLNDANSPIAIFTAPSNISSDMDITFELAVTDDKNATNIANVKVTDKYVPPPNQPPTANAGSDQTVVENTTVILDGNKSSDPDGHIKSYSWKQIAGVPLVTLNGVSTPKPSFTTPHALSDTPLRFEMMITDDKGATSTDTVDVKIRNLSSPTSNHLPMAINQNFSTSENTPVGITLQGFDVDNDKLSSSIVTDPSHGTISYDESISSFVYTPDLDYFGSDSFTFKVDDGKGNSTNDGTIHISINQMTTISGTTTQNSVCNVSADAKSCVDSKVGTGNDHSSGSKHDHHSKGGSGGGSSHGGGSSSGGGGSSHGGGSSSGGGGSSSGGGGSSSGGSGD